jgi:hypothetical protein
MSGMMKTNRKTIAGIIVLLLVGVATWAWTSYAPVMKSARDSNAAMRVVEEFGARQKNVNLVAAEETLRSSVDAEYAPYVTSELLAEWVKNPALAPGKHGSVSTPDRLAIAKSVAQGSGWIVEGEVVRLIELEAETESVQSTPFIALVIPADTGWKIAAYQEEFMPVLKNIPLTDEDLPGDR